MLVVMLILSACSSKGVRMPKHRKRSHCDCPTFSYRLSDTLSMAQQQAYSTMVISSMRCDAPANLSMINRQ